MMLLALAAKCGFLGANGSTGSFFASANRRSLSSDARPREPTPTVQSLKNWRRVRYFRYSSWMVMVIRSRYPFVIVSSRFSSTLAMTVHAASCRVEILRRFRQPALRHRLRGDGVLAVHLPI